MSKLLTLEHTSFANAMKEDYDMTQNITSVDIFDTFVKTLSVETNVLSPEKLKGLVFRQFKEYGDFDETVEAVAQSVCDIKQSTQDAITAIDKKDTGALKAAYEKLKAYEERIQKMETDMYTDEVTGMYNRKYLLKHLLDDEECFKSDGVLIHVSINNFLKINNEHGHDSGDAVIKYVSKLFQKNLKIMGVHFIRYMGVQFVAVVKEGVATKAEKVCQDTADLILKQKFKTRSGEHLSVDLQVDVLKFVKAQSFQEVYKKL